MEVQLTEWLNWVGPYFPHSVMALLFRLRFNLHKMLGYMSCHLFGICLQIGPGPVLLTVWRERGPGLEMVTYNSAQIQPSGWEKDRLGLPLNHKKHKKKKKKKIESAYNKNMDADPTFSSPAEFISSRNISHITKLMWLSQQSVTSESGWFWGFSPRWQWGSQSCSATSLQEPTMEGR